MASEFDHLYALEDRLDRELARLRAARTARDIAFREHEIRMCEREIEGERRFLTSKGITVPAPVGDMTLDEILAELDI